MAFSKRPRHNLSPFCSPQEEANSAVMMELFPASKGMEKTQSICKARGGNTKWRRERTQVGKTVELPKAIAKERCCVREFPCGLLA